MDREIQLLPDLARQPPAEAVEEGADVGEGIRVGSVKDPFGNILGIIHNPHFHYQEKAG